MKKLKELTLKEHDDLKRSGLMWVVFPDATGDFRDDFEEVKKVKDKCEWIDGKFVSCDDFDWNIIEYNLTSGGKMKKCYHCKADIRKPKSLIDKREELFENWWNDNLGSQPPLIDPCDSPSIIRKKFCQIGFFGCYDLEESEK